MLLIANCSFLILRASRLPHPSTGLHRRCEFNRGQTAPSRRTGAAASIQTVTAELACRPLTAPSADGRAARPDVRRSLGFGIGDVELADAFACVAEGDADGHAFAVGNLGTADVGDEKGLLRY
jgi:hypothetical protein